MLRNNSSKLRRNGHGKIVLKLFTNVPITATTVVKTRTAEISSRSTIQIKKSWVKRVTKWTTIKPCLTARESNSKSKRAGQNHLVQAWPFLGHNRKQASILHCYSASKAGRATTCMAVGHPRARGAHPCRPSAASHMCAAPPPATAAPPAVHLPATLLLRRKAQLKRRLAWPFFSLSLFWVAVDEG